MYNTNTIPGISGLLANCQNTSTITVPFFNLNLPLAFAFNMSTFNLQSDFTYEQPIILNLPNISAALEALSAETTSHMV